MESEDPTNTIALMAAILYASESHEIAVTQLPTEASKEDAVRRAKEIYELVLTAR